MSDEWDENDFDHRLSNLEASWRTAERLGTPQNRADKIWDRLSLELEFSKGEFAGLINVAVWGRKWIEERNPHYVDLAYLACRQAQIEIPPTLLELMDEVAEERFSGVLRYGTGK